jgi:DNA-binding NtrC family response regulator
MPSNRSTVSRRRARPESVAAARARLCAVYPRGLDWRAVLDGTPCEIGREPEAPGMLDDGTVSRRHCAVAWDPERRRHVVTDAGSRNGTSVDGRPVPAEGAALGPGSVVRVGDVLLVYERGRDADVRDDAAWSRAMPGDALPMRVLRAAIARVAADRAPVLVHGETGAGKEYAVRAVHEASARRGPLVAVNCAALSAQLVEAQLFGHVRGAFTGAGGDQPGFFRAAHGGTLFLDEIGELPLELQPKLLRAIQDRAVVPVGGTRPAEVDVRVIAATNRTLADEVAAGRFRRDLYARLAMWDLRVPPLRERRRDLLGWLDRLRAEHAPGAAPLALHPDAAERILVGDWPENLRGLARLAHALAEADGPIEVRDLPPWLQAATEAEPAAAPARRRAPGKDAMAQLYADTNGNVREMARVLACERRQIYRWLDAYGLRRGPRP